MSLRAPDSALCTLPDGEAVLVRCDTCQNWDQRYVPYPDFGECHLLNKKLTDMGTINTPRDFWCAGWEPKE